MKISSLVTFFGFLLLETTMTNAQSQPDAWPVQENKSALENSKLEDNRSFNETTLLSLDSEDESSNISLVEDSSVENITELVTVAVPDPIIVRHPRSLTVKVKDTLNFTCKFDTEVDCKWVRNGEDVELGNSYIYAGGHNGRNTTDCSLTIVSASLVDNGIWTCAALPETGSVDSLSYLGQPSNALLTVIPYPEEKENVKIMYNETNENATHNSTSLAEMDNLLNFTDSQTANSTKSGTHQINGQVLSAKDTLFPLILTGVVVVTAVGITCIIVTPAGLYYCIKKKKPKRASYID